jgi:hypothetical protein
MRKSKSTNQSREDDFTKAKLSSYRTRTPDTGESLYQDTISSDLILRAMLHVQHWPDWEQCYPQDLFDYCYEALDSWAKTSRTSTVSSRIKLGVVLDHALSLKKDPKYASWTLEQAGKTVLDLDTFVSDRLKARIAQEARHKKAKQILESSDCISVFEAAREVTGCRNPTEAVNRLKLGLSRLREDYGPIQSPPYMSGFVMLLDRALIADTIAQKRRKILPRELIKAFSPFLRRFLAQKTSESRRTAANKSHRSRKIPGQDKKSRTVQPARKSRA